MMVVELGRAQIVKGQGWLPATALTRNRSCGSEAAAPSEHKFLTNCIAEGKGGLWTTAAAEPGLGVATIWRRHPSTGAQGDSKDARLSLRHDERGEQVRSSVREVALLVQGVSHMDSRVTVAEGGKTSHRRG